MYASCNMIFRPDQISSCVEGKRFNDLCLTCEMSLQIYRIHLTVNWCILIVHIAWLFSPFDLVNLVFISFIFKCKMESPLILHWFSQVVKSLTFLSRRSHLSEITTDFYMHKTFLTLFCMFTHTHKYQLINVLCLRHLSVFNHCFMDRQLDYFHCFKFLQRKQVLVSINTTISYIL